MLGWIAETTLVAAALAALGLGLDRSRRWSSEAKHAVWVVVLLKFVLPPVVAWPRPAPGAPAVEASPGAAPIGPKLASVDPPTAGPPPGEPSSPVGPGAPPAAPAESPAAETKPTTPDRSGATDEPGPPAAGRSGPRSTPPDAPTAARAADSPVPQPPPPSLTSPGPPGGPAPASVPVPASIPAPVRVGWSALVLGAWGLGSLVVGGRTLARVGRFGRRLARGREASEATRAEVAAVAARVGAGGPGSIRVVPGLAGPLVWCLGRPVLVLPEGFERLPAATRSSLLAHELAHLARGDHWVARLELLAGLLWWWNPVFRLARARTRRAAEAACDARVVRAYPESRFAYAEALVAASARSRVAPPLPALGSGDAARTLEARLTMILRDPARPPSRWPRPVAAALVALSLPSWTLARQEPAPATGSPPPADARPTGDAPPIAGPSPASPAPSVPTPPRPIVAGDADGGDRPDALIAPAAPTPPLVAAGEAPPRAEPPKAADWTIKDLADGVSGRPGPRRNLAFRHTATWRLAPSAVRGPSWDSAPPGVRVQAADVLLANNVAEEGDAPKSLDPNAAYFQRLALGGRARIDVLQAADKALPIDPETPPEPADGPTTPRPDWYRWFAASDAATSVTFRANAGTRGSIPILWSGMPQGYDPPATDDLTPRFYRNRQMGFGGRSGSGTGPLLIRPEALIDMAGPMALLFHPGNSAGTSTLKATRQLVGVETIEGVEVARVAWLVEGPDAMPGRMVQGLAWVAPRLGHTVVRFEATTAVQGVNGQRTTWRRSSSGYRRVGDLWLPGRVEYRAEVHASQEDRAMPRVDLIATFEDYRIDAEVPDDAFAPRMTMAALDPGSGSFTAEPPPVPAGLAERLKQAVAASPFGPPRIDAPTGGMGGGGMMGGGRMAMGGGGMMGGMGGGGMAMGAGGMMGGLRRAEPAPSGPAPAAEPARPGPAKPAGTDPGRADHPAIAATTPTRPAADPAPTVRSEMAPAPASAPILKARRDAQAAEVARAEAGLKLAEAVAARNASLNKRIPNSVSREEVQKAEAEAELARATVDREKAKLAEADATLAEVPARPTAPTPDDRPASDVLKARRDAQAAELARAEAGVRVAEIKFANTAKLASGPRPAVSKNEVELLRGELDQQRATADRERARLAEVDALITEARRRPTAPTSYAEAELIPRPLGLADLRDQADLLELRIEGKRGEVEFARATADRATATLNDRQKLIRSNAIGAASFRETEEAAGKARLDLAGRDGELRQLELRLNQTQARIEGETASLRRQAERVKARLVWSRTMLAKGFVSRETFEKARGEYDDLMFQLDPGYKPEPEPEPAGEAAAPPPAASRAR